MPEQAVDFISSVIQGMNSLQIAGPPNPSIVITTEAPSLPAQQEGHAQDTPATTATEAVAKASVPTPSFSAVTDKDPITGDMLLCEYRHDYMDQLTHQWADQV